MEYFSNIYKSASSLLSGMKLTGYYFVHPKRIITEQYPDNRNTLQMAERFKGELILTHDEENKHKCTGCTACEIACPNGSIKILTRRETTADGKSKKRLETFVYHLDMCTFCSLCIDACPTDALKMAPNFEHSVYDRSYLTKILENPGSELVENLK
ncbi:MAG: 4Fe-4S binding protein [Bacteroidia bacterium]